MYDDFIAPGEGLIHRQRPTATDGDRKESVMQIVISPPLGHLGSYRRPTVAAGVSATESVWESQGWLLKAKWAGANVRGDRARSTARRRS